MPPALPTNFPLFLIFGGNHPRMLILYSIVLAILFLIVRLCFALGVYRDAVRQGGPTQSYKPIQHRAVTQPVTRQEGSLFFVGPKIWFLAVLVIGLPVALAYWVLHHSTFRFRPLS